MQGTRTLNGCKRRAFPAPSKGLRNRIRLLAVALSNRKVVTPTAPPGTEYTNSRAFPVGPGKYDAISSPKPQRTTTTHDVTTAAVAAFPLAWIAVQSERNKRFAGPSWRWPSGVSRRGTRGRARSLAVFENRPCQGESIADFTWNRSSSEQEGKGCVR